MGNKAMTFTESQLEDYQVNKVVINNDVVRLFLVGSVRPKRTYGRYYTIGWVFRFFFPVPVSRVCFHWFTIFTRFVDHYSIRTIIYCVVSAASQRSRTPLLHNRITCFGGVLNGLKVDRYIVSPQFYGVVMGVFYPCSPGGKIFLVTQSGQ